ncbi:hypothetical protein AAFF_G00274480 [Aldrovandia affinis]|uniref:Mitochondrial antiviral-signaling protein n=1 Tax=Aldrovandia affinis TaxID=143900 RepID=A0AAD7WSB2_9TELE|nr:hypothetical protein AAFF_G00274480 [Aldrovandia affinis]
MPFASDGLYDGYLRREMGNIVTTVKVREIIPFLPCLTPSDRDEINAKTDTTGNYNGMQLLLDCLRRRENWPEEFIGALERCEQRVLAGKIRAEYERLLGPRAPAAPAVNSHPSPPRRAAVEPLQTPVVADPLPQASPQQETASAERSLTPTNTEASAAVVPSQNPAAPSGQDPPAASSQAPPSDEPDQSQSSETTASAPAVIPPVPQVSPGKSPVQDSNPPVSNGTHQPVENSDPTVNQVATNDQQAQPPQAGSPAQQPSRTTASAAGSRPHRQPGWPLRRHRRPAAAAEEDECFSKAETLHSFRDVPPIRPAERAEALPPVAEEPYSGSSDRLQFSGSSDGSGAPSHNEPEEDDYESVHRSLLGSLDVRVNVGHVSEGLPVLNQTGQAPGSSDGRPVSAPSQDYGAPEPARAAAGPGRPGQQRASPEREEGAVPPCNALERYYIPAAVAGASALVMLWWLRNK